MQAIETDRLSGNTPKRVVFFGINSSKSFSGGRYYAWLLAEALAEAGWDVSYVTTARPLFYDDFTDPALFPAHNRIKMHYCPINGQRACRMPAIDCDVVLLVPQTGRSRVVYERGLAFAARNRARIALLSFEAANWFNALSPVKRDPRDWDGWRLVSRCAALILSLAAEGTAWARCFYDAAPPSALFEHLWAPINTRAADATGDVPKEKRILFLTRFAFCDHKGGDLVPQLLCEAMRGYTAVFIVGMGKPDREYLRQIREKAAAYGIGIDILHTLSEAEKWREFKRAALVLFPSFFEGFGLPPVEAQIAGTPCIAFDLPVLREVNGDGIFYVPPGDTAAMREKAAEVLKMETDWTRLRKNFGPAAEFDDFIRRADSLFSRLLRETLPLRSAAEAEPACGGAEKTPTAPAALTSEADAE
jgi:glycosyltransferase involved in cell wall biosynthesis